MKNRDQGSAFLEAMVAAAIISLSLTTMYRSVVDGTMHGRAVEEKRLAMLVAQSELAVLETTASPSLGDLSGTQGPFVWHGRIEPYDADSSENSAGVLREAEITVQRPGDTKALVTLRTLLLEPAS